MWITWSRFGVFTNPGERVHRWAGIQVQRYSITIAVWVGFVVIGW